MRLKSSYPRDDSNFTVYTAQLYHPDICDSIAALRDDILHECSYEGCLALAEEYYEEALSYLREGDAGNALSYAEDSCGLFKQLGSYPGVLKCESLLGG